ncbi:hypothetical protein JB92DRAFT_3072218 [Gautieria morchelliformis]|nr:hypothetical protein JB92DRAFT_3072218 [Gautieria morchelliformis]
MLPSLRRLLSLSLLSPRLPSVESNSRYLLYPSVSCRAVFYQSVLDVLAPPPSPASLIGRSPLVLSSL